MPDDLANSELAPSSGGEYVVIARRYRPQSFDELIGQDHVARAMAGAIESHRVGHAYLFTGARGVGKTSSARILAKCLNCASGPTTTPCNECEICRDISAGSDVDVLEIDGASNRGVDEIRQLRQNVAVRPSRARFKIYIIDEVHMLTREAFNALLKTLEEPPEHVKFIFCTTEPEKVPITIHSRCQRFDFAGIPTGAIVERLAKICEQEGVRAEPAALEIIARRAAGSMRDSQSILEQVLSCCRGDLTADQLHKLLGTATGRRFTALVGHLVARDTAAALGELDAAVAEGVDVGQLLEQLLGYFRDVMAACVGCAPGAYLFATSNDEPQVRSAAATLGVESVLAILQILDHTLARLRLSTHSRTLAEVAIVRICKLEDLEELSSLVAAVRSSPGGVAATASASTNTRAVPAQAVAEQKKNVIEAAAVGTEESAPDGESNGMNSVLRPEAVALTADSVSQVWSQALARITGMVSTQAARCRAVSLAAPDRLLVQFGSQDVLSKAACERPEQASALERALAEVVGHVVRVEFALEQATAAAAPPKDRPNPRQRMTEHPLVKRAVELFGATTVRVDEPPG